MYLYKSTNSVKAKECILCLFQDLRKWQPTPVLLPGESQGWGSLVGCRLWGLTKSDMTEATSQQQQQEHIIWRTKYSWLAI